MNQYREIALTLDTYADKARFSDINGPDLRADLKMAAAALRDLDKLAFVPGLWRCAKCECQVISNTLHAGTGNISANNEPQSCPNNCGPMWRVSERDAGNRLIDNADKERERVRPFVQGAYHALRSYEFGNSAPGLAKAAADGLKIAFPYAEARS